MKSFLTIIRIPNLLVIILTQALIRYYVIQPVVNEYGFRLSFPFLFFVILVFVTVLIAAAGYVINDYYDVKADYINRPDRSIVGKKLSRSTTFILFVVLLVIALLFGAYVALFSRMTELLLIFIIISGLLWFYSYSYSKQFLVGNLVIAALTAMVPLLIGLTEIKSLLIVYKGKVFENMEMIEQVKYWVLAFSSFAFLTTLTREIIKDTEDFQGDLIDNRNTIPIVLGEKVAKIIVILLVALLIVSIGFVYVKYLPFHFFSIIYILITLIIPLAYIIYSVWLATDKNDYHRVSEMLKFIMVAGILFAMVNKYLMS